jgi:hypothetical protein
VFSILVVYISKKKEGNKGFTILTLSTVAWILIQVVISNKDLIVWPSVIKSESDFTEVQDLKSEVA